MRRVRVFVVYYILWLLLAWPYRPDKGWDAQVLALGIGAAFLAAVLFKEEYPETARRRCSAAGRCLWLLAYIPVFAYYCIKANIDVLYRVLHPEMPINPGIVKIKTNLRSPAALTALANSITLAPGTMTLDITGDGYLYIHCIYVKGIDTEKAAGIIAERFEKFIGRIFE